MKKIRKTLLVLLLSFSVGVGSVGVQSTQSEAFIIGSLVKWGIKKAAKKIVGNAVKKGVKKIAGNALKNGVKKAATNALKKGVKKLKEIKKARELAEKKRLLKKAKAFKVRSRSETLFKGDRLSLKPSNCYGNKIKWKSSNNKVATVSSKGVVKAKSKGKATITAIPSISKKKTKIKIKVKTITVTNKSITLTEGEHFDISKYDIDYFKSSNDKVAYVYDDIEEAEYFIIAEKAGTCKITLELSNCNKVIFTVKVVKQKEETNTPKPEPSPSPSPEKPSPSVSGGAASVTE